MIPRDILKKIRQIELRTNRIVTATLAGFSFQPSPQLRRIPRAVPDGKNFDFKMFDVDGELNRVRPRFGHFGFPRQRRRQSKSFGVLSQSLEKRLKFIIKPPADASFTFFIPVHGIIPFPLGFGLRNDFERHLLARRRFLISAETSSMGVPRPGCLSASSARRSSSTICSGVSSSSNRSRSCSKTSRCSSNGSWSSCSKTWAWLALMGLIYSVERNAQLKIRHSPFAISP